MVIFCEGGRHEGGENIDNDGKIIPNMIKVND